MKFMAKDRLPVPPSSIGGSADKEGRYKEEAGGAPPLKESFDTCALLLVRLVLIFETIYEKRGTRGGEKEKERTTRVDTQHLV